VNFNVLLALRLLGSPATDAERRAAIALAKRTRGASRYYCSPSTTAYAAKRAGVSPFDLDPAVNAKPPRKDIQAMAQRIIAVGPDPQAARSIIKNQRENGGWTAGEWCRDIKGNVWVSEAITTAICVEALQAFKSSAEVL
jgi:hypothetical protein